MYQCKFWREAMTATSSQAWSYFPQIHCVTFPIFLSHGEAQVSLFSLEGDWCFVGGALVTDSKTCLTLAFLGSQETPVGQPITQ